MQNISKTVQTIGAFGGACVLLSGCSFSPRSADQIESDSKENFRSTGFKSTVFYKIQSGTQIRHGVECTNVDLHFYDHGLYTVVLSSRDRDGNANFAKWRVRSRGPSSDFETPSKHTVYVKGNSMIDVVVQRDEGLAKFGGGGNSYDETLEFSSSGNGMLAGNRNK